MCFSTPKQTAATPAPAPEAPAPPPDQQDIGGQRRAENIANYGATSPNLRVRDSSISSGGVGSSGSGLNM